jgi:hypothetical protein
MSKMVASRFPREIFNLEESTAVSIIKIRTLDLKLKLLAIVKLFIHYEFQPPGGWAMGTGWLIKDDLLVTAGHCSYDWKYKWGRATEVKAYIGYKGKNSVNDRNVQFRSVKQIVTTEGWLKARGARNFDVGFMQVDKPFTGITPFKFEETPATGDKVLGVVGYPGDLSNQGEGGALMYEMFLQVNRLQRALSVLYLLFLWSRLNGILGMRRIRCWSIKLILLEVTIVHVDMDFDVEDIQITRASNLSHVLQRNFLSLYYSSM